jgi:hypothetical protein
VEPRRLATGRLEADQQSDPESSIGDRDVVEARLDRIVLEARQELPPMA